MTDLVQDISTQEAATLLGVSRPTVVRLIQDGKLRAHIPGRTRRRLARAEVLAYRDREHSRVQQPSSFPGLTLEQERSLWLHRAVAGALMQDPDRVLAEARATIGRWKMQHRADGNTRRALDEWARLVDAGVDAVAHALTSSEPRFSELRQNSPFAGALTDAERSRVLAAFTSHRKRDHAQP